MGTLQATEALKLLLGIGDPLVGRLLLVDALRLDLRRGHAAPRPELPGVRRARRADPLHRLRGSSARAATEPRLRSAVWRGTTCRSSSACRRSSARRWAASATSRSTGTTLSRGARRPVRAFPGVRDHLVDGAGQLNRFVNVYVENEDVRLGDGLRDAARAGRRRCGSSRRWRVARGESRRGPGDAGAPARRALGDRRHAARRAATAPRRRAARACGPSSSRPTRRAPSRTAWRWSLIEAAERDGLLEPGQIDLEPTSGNTGISLAMVCQVSGYRLRAVMPESATPERARLAAHVRRRDRVVAGRQGSNGAVRLARELAAARRLASTCRSSTRTRPTRTRTTAAPGPRSSAALDGRVDAFVAGLGTGGTLMGTGRALREARSDVQIVAAEPLQGDPVSGLRSLDDGYVPEVLDIVDARPQDAGLQRRRARRPARAARPRGHLGGRLRRRRAGRRHGASRPTGSRAERRLLFADGGWKYASAGLWTPASRRARGRTWRSGSGGDRRPRRCSCRARWRTSSWPTRGPDCPTRPAGSSPASTPPSPASTRPSTATRARSATRSTRADLLRIVTDIEDADEDVLAIYHSHTQSPAFPSRTDVDLAFWPDAAYLIVSLATRSGRPEGVQHRRAQDREARPRGHVISSASRSISS